MKVDGNSLRPGNIVSHKGKVWRVVKTQHVKPGKGGAFLQCELSELREGTKLHERFRASESVERLRLEERAFQFLYRSGLDSTAEYTFMDKTNYEQLLLPARLIGEAAARFLEEGMDVTLGISEGEVLTVSMPETVEVDVADADAVVKGQTQSGSFKPATLSNGVRVMVPPYVEGGMRIVIRIEDLRFIERVKR